MQDETSRPENRVPTSRPFDGVFQFWTIKIGRVGRDLTFLLIGHRVDFGLSRFGINEAVNTQTAL